MPVKKNQLQQYVTIQEVAAALHVCDKSVRRRMAAGDLEWTTFGTRRLIDAASLARLLERNSNGHAL